MLDVCILGTQGGMPMVNKFMSSIIVGYKGKKILFDCGEGTQVSMRKYRTGFKNIDIICISHAHGDHILGLPGLLSTMGNSDRLETVTIVGPKGIKEIVQGLNVVNPYMPFKLKIIELDGNEIDLYDDLRLSSIKLDHSTECIGYSLKLKRAPKFSIEKARNNEVPQELWGKLQKGMTIKNGDNIYTPEMVLGKERQGIKFSYITDTRPNENIIDFIKDSDLFICEGTYTEDSDIDKAIKNKHMTFKEAATLASKGNCKELILTHFSPAIDDPNEYEQNAKEVFNETIIGYEGLRKTVRFCD